MDILRFQVDTLTIEVHPDSKSSSLAAVEAASQIIDKGTEGQDPLTVIFATGGSQVEMLDALVQRSDVAWNKIVGFHLDEYVGINENHPASFRRYLREHLTTRVTMREFNEIDGNATDLDAFCAGYSKRLNEGNPQLCLLGIGENGHLAFNDPGEADFHDPRGMKVVQLDAACRDQQVAEGWFSQAGTRFPNRLSLSRFPPSCVFRILSSLCLVSVRQKLCDRPLLSRSRRIARRPFYARTRMRLFSLIRNRRRN